MSIRIFKNQTSNPIYLNDISEIIPASGQKDIGNRASSELAQSEDLLNNIANGNLVLNIGGDIDVEPMSRAISIIRQIPQVFQTTADAKLLVLASPKPGKTTFQLTSKIDSSTGTSNDRLHIAHTVFQYGQDTQGVLQRCGLFVDTGQNTEFSKYWLNSKYINFSVLNNRTYIFDGGLTWNGLGNTGLVTVSLDVVPTTFDPTSYVVTPGQGNAFIYGGYLVVPHPTNQGTHTLPIGQVDYQTPQNLNFAEVKPSIAAGLYEGPLFWTIEYNLSSAKFQNLQINADPYNSTQNVTTDDPNVIKMVGNLFTQEITLMSLIKDLLIAGDVHGFFTLNSVDPMEVGYGLRLKLDTKTVVNDIYTNVAWRLVGYIKTYKERAL